jgi:hypothetical protein
MKTVRLMILTVLALSSCAGLPTRGAHFRKEGLPSAAFTMNCAAEQVKVTALGGSLEDAIEFQDRIGVEGCGQRVVYIYAYGAGWVADTASTKPASP